MESRHDNIFETLVKRWATRSPKAYRVVTNVSLGVGVIASLVLIIPSAVVTLPAWALPAAAFAVAIASKLTIDEDVNDNKNP